MLPLARMGIEENPSYKMGFLWRSILTKSELNDANKIFAAENFLKNDLRYKH